MDEDDDDINEDGLEAGNIYVNLIQQNPALKIIGIYLA